MRWNGNDGVAQSIKQWDTRTKFKSQARRMRWHGRAYPSSKGKYILYYIHMFRHQILHKKSVRVTVTLSHTILPAINVRADGSYCHCCCCCYCFCWYFNSCSVVHLKICHQRSLAHRELCYGMAWHGMVRCGCKPATCCTHKHYHDNNE